MINTYKEALLKYNTMLLQNETSDNIKYQVEYIKKLENKIQEELNNFKLLKQDLANKNNTNYYRVSYVNSKNRQNYRYQYAEDGKMKSVVRNTIEELEMAVKEKGLPWIKLEE